VSGKPSKIEQPHSGGRRHPITIMSPTAQPAAAHPQKPGRSTRETSRICLERRSRHVIVACSAWETPASAR
jgi:hypothetical protein